MWDTLEELGLLVFMHATTAIARETLGQYTLNTLVAWPTEVTIAATRLIFSGVSANELPLTLEKILRAYLKHRQGKETFQQFTTRHEVGKLQEMFE